MSKNITTKLKYQKFRSKIINNYFLWKNGKKWWKIRNTLVKKFNWKFINDIEKNQEAIVLIKLKIKYNKKLVINFRYIK